MTTLYDHLSAAPYTLALSSGFFGFFAHAGALAALEDAGVSPAGFAGSSAGALVGGVAASGVSALDLFDVLRTVRRQDFWDVRPGWGLLRGDRFRALLADVVGVPTFAACPHPVVVTAWDVVRRQPQVLNDGDLAGAIHASCAFPGLLQPVTIGGRKFLDGGIGDRPGLLGVPSGARVLHHHLSSRSPWRRADSAALKPPSGAGLTALVVDGLPRLSPFHLDRGPAAFDAAYASVSEALELPLCPIVRVAAPKRRT